MAAQSFLGLSGESRKALRMGATPEHRHAFSGAANPERRHSCRPVRAAQDRADKNVGAPHRVRFRRSVARPALEFGSSFKGFLLR